MLIAHPVVLRKLLARYEALSAVRDPGAETLRDLDDVTYTLCVSTGTRTIDAALGVARERLARAAAEERTAPVALRAKESAPRRISGSGPTPLVPAG
ncbi:MULTISPECIES: DUF5133 domain-containing protein [Streptomyces]|uniref:DUF5133 domain-containing protein n=1 Tax=Streptomyces evansiae TaxID=3075535 RepID=A0ABU2QWZ6_9ACTN|nr:MULTISPECIES: DUF5133 domain-containing protein [unclassified Streptomyces]MDT0408622.1 DUF5133 domain-containing protein [Streptomyces sp. DSM 41979]MDT0421765.1 DUF5133 domain-containing protein [Streptomyces sp. DSM 41859]MYQ57200.1 DUF5133 domain-containing protein [Streptomyces sp. SID4926]WEH26139.1 DUF5133 domain-containing protein [Streptomyces sp. AM 3-1-1]